MAKKDRPGFTVEAKLVAATPKVGSNDNLLELKVEVPLPKPKPPLAFAKWEDSYSDDGGYRLWSDHTRKLQPLRERHKKALEAQVDDEARDELEAKNDAEYAALDQELLAIRQQAYDKYVAKATNKLNSAMTATLSTGLFVALLGQNVTLTLQPSSELFQPMLDGVYEAQRSIPMLAAATDEDEEAEPDD